MTLTISQRTPTKTRSKVVRDGLMRKQNNEGLRNWLATMTALQVGGFKKDVEFMIKRPPYKTKYKEVQARWKGVLEKRNLDKIEWDDLKQEEAFGLIVEFMTFSGDFSSDPAKPFGRSAAEFQADAVKVHLDRKYDGRYGMLAADLKQRVKQIEEWAS